MSEQTSRLLDDLWEFLGFFANAILFLLIGLSVNLAALMANATAVAVAIASVLLARVVVVQTVAFVTTRGGVAVPNSDRVVLIWAGLRGALTVALALGLPLATPARELIINMAFGVVLFTLIAQGLTLQWVIRLLGIRRGMARPRAPLRRSEQSGNPR
jgi:CPA1 family monovalent cation:H+ antiporter